MDTNQLPNLKPAFATESQVRMAMCLTLLEIRQALELTGEPDSDNELRGVCYRGYNSKQFVYEGHYVDKNTNEDGIAPIFVTLRRDDNGDFRYFAEN